MQSLLAERIVMKFNTDMLQIHSLFIMHKLDIFTVNLFLEIFFLNKIALFLFWKAYVLQVKYHYILKPIVINVVKLGSK